MGKRSLHAKRNVAADGGLLGQCRPRFDVEDVAARRHVQRHRRFELLKRLAVLARVGHRAADGAAVAVAKLGDQVQAMGVLGAVVVDLRIDRERVASLEVPRGNGCDWDDRLDGLLADGQRRPRLPGPERQRAEGQPRAGCPGNGVTVVLPLVA